MPESTRRYYEYTTCRHCYSQIFRSVQPRMGQLPLRSFWKHSISKNRECAPRLADARVGHIPLQSFNGPGKHGY